MRDLPVSGIAILASGLGKGDGELANFLVSHVLPATEEAGIPAWSRAGDNLGLVALAIVVGVSAEQARGAVRAAGGGDEEVAFVGHAGVLIASLCQS